MRYLLIILLSTSSIFLLGQKVKLKYEVIQNIKFTKEGKNNFNNLDRERRKKFLEQNQNPEPSNYYNYISNDFSVLKYLSKIDNSQENSNSNVKIAPFGFGYSFRIPNEANVIINIKSLGENVFAKYPSNKIIWNSTKKDSIILNYKVKLVEGVDSLNQTKVKAWVTKDLPRNRGIFDLNYPDGYVLAFEKFIYSPNKDINYVSIKAYPKYGLDINQREFKKITKMVNNIKNSKILSMKEVEKMLQEMNENKNLNN